MPILGFKRFVGLIASNAQLDREAGNQAEADETSCEENASVLLHMRCHTDHPQKNSRYLESLTEAGMLYVHTVTVAS